MRIEEIPAISLSDFTTGKIPCSSEIKSNAIAVIRFLAKASKYFLFCVFNCNAENKTLCGFIYSISLSDGGSTFKIKLQLTRNSDLTFNLYEGGRHEMLNETNAEDVKQEILSWINART